MSKVHVVAKRDFLESLTTARPLVGLAELIWNGFDAGSDRVEVHLDLNQLGGIEAIRVRDHGSGINHEHVEALFGSLGDSWKKKKTRDHGRVLHGKSGKGRFRAFALGTLVDWKTTFRGGDQKTRSYQIRGLASSLDDFEISDLIEAFDTPTGTEVVISNLRHDFGSLTHESAAGELGRLFAAYLTEYPHFTLEYRGVRIEPKDAQAHRADYPLDNLTLSDNRVANATVSVVEWTMPTERALHLCDANGLALHEAPAGRQIRAPGFNFTAYVKSDYFLELERQNLLVLDDLHPDLEAILTAAKGAIKDHFRRRMQENQGQVIMRWKNDGVYPFEDKKSLNPVEKAERQVFDILAVQVESHLPNFAEADAQSRKFTFRLLAKAICENPGSIPKLFGDVLKLKKEDQEELIGLLQETTLSSVIGLAGVVATRLEFLKNLETLLRPSADQPATLEPGELRGILENQTWVLDDEFGLAGNDKRLEAALLEHQGKNAKVAATGPFHKVRRSGSGELEYLIVDIQVPGTKAAGESLTLLTEFAHAVARDSRFRGLSARWTWLTISHEVGEVTAAETSHSGKSMGRVVEDADLKLTIWVKTWSEIISNARARLSFTQQQLAEQADTASAKTPLKKTHLKYIPTST